MISEFPLFVFTVLTGIAAGAYVGAALFPKKGDDSKPWLFPLVALILVGVGSLAAMAHLDRPHMVMNVLNNPTASITMEGMTAGLLAVVVIVDLALCASKKQANRAVRIVGAIAGVLCMCVVTSAYVTSYGNPAWIATPTWPLFFAGDLAAGIALWMAFADMPNKPLATIVAVLAALFAVVLIWQAVTFAGLDKPFGFIMCGAVFAIAGAVGAWITASTKLWNTAAKVVFVLLLVALVASRYGFYLVSII